MLSPLLIIFLSLATNCLIISTSLLLTLSSFVSPPSIASSGRLLLLHRLTIPSLGGVTLLFSPLFLKEEDLWRPSIDPLLTTPGEGMGLMISDSFCADNLLLIVLTMAFLWRFEMLWWDDETWIKKKDENL